MRPWGLPGASSSPNTNQLLATDPAAVGIKTGVTTAAGQCLVAAASRSGRQVVAVVLGSSDRYASTSALLSSTPAPA